MDASHGDLHIGAVRSAARKLAEKYAPGLVELVDEAARLHDCGRAVSDENHELVGAKLVSQDETLRAKWSEEEFALLVEAVREHRASTGRPVGVVARIVSDADRMGKPEEMNPLRRAYLYGLERGLAQTPDEALRRAAAHIVEKYDDGYGCRAYFPETSAWISAHYGPIIQAAKAGDWETLRAIAGV